VNISRPFSNSFCYFSEANHERMDQPTYTDVESHRDYDSQNEPDDKQINIITILPDQDGDVASRQ